MLGYRKLFCYKYNVLFCKGFAIDFSSETPLLSRMIFAVTYDLLIRRPPFSMLWCLRRTLEENVSNTIAILLDTARGFFLKVFM